MTISLNHNGTLRTADTDAAVDISIPLRFGGDQPNAFFLPHAAAVVAEGGEFLGDTRRGGSCNCETVTLNPHGNGTHTECVGHLSVNRLAVRDAVRELLVPCLLVSVDPQGDGEGGFRITWEQLDDEVRRHRGAMAVDTEIPALAIRTLPNSTAKMEAEWSGNRPPYLAPAAAEWIRSRGVRHLLVDIPSLDREDDPLLTAHRIFWELPADGPVEGDPADGRTITEMIFVPDRLADGVYLLNIQVPPFMLDAAPSRPLLIPLS